MLPPHSQTRMAQAPVALRTAGVLGGRGHRAGPAIAPVRERLTARAGRWATRQAGRGRPVKDLASELGCSWHPVNTSVRRWGGALIDADTARISDVFALGLDETLMWRRGRFRTKAWATGIVDVASGQLLDMVRGRTAKAPTQMARRDPRVERITKGWHLRVGEPDPTEPVMRDSGAEAIRFAGPGAGYGALTAVNRVGWNWQPTIKAQVCVVGRAPRATLEFCEFLSRANEARRELAGIQRPQSSQPPQAAKKADADAQAVLRLAAALAATVGALPAHRMSPHAISALVAGPDQT